MQNKYSWHFSPQLRRSARWLLLLLMLAVSAGTAWAIVGHNQKPALAAPSFLKTILPGYEPWGVTHDRAEHIWVAEPECDPNIYNHPVCASTIQGNLIEYSETNFHDGAQPLQVQHEPSGYSSPFFIAVDASNNLWFSEPVTNALGELDHLGNWHQWNVPTPGASPFDLIIDNYGHIWFTEPGASAIGEFNPDAQQFTAFPTPTTNSAPYGIVGPDPQTGSIWFTENNNQVHRIGRLFPTSGGGISGSIQEYIAPATNNNTPHLITADNRGNIWWSEGWAGNIGQLVISQVVNNSSDGIYEYKVPSPGCPTGSNCGVHISGIAAASNGVIWFDDSLSSQIGSYTPGSGFAMYTLEGSVSSGSHPHDGLSIDSDNNIWLSEEFGNRLLEIVENQPGALPTSTPTRPKPTPTPGGTMCPGFHEHSS